MNWGAVLGLEKFGMDGKYENRVPIRASNIRIGYGN
jgi:hypothetical protein